MACGVTSPQHEYIKAATAERLAEALALFVDDGRQFRWEHEGQKLTWLTREQWESACAALASFEETRP